MKTSLTSLIPKLFLLTTSYVWCVTVLLSLLGVLGRVSVAASALVGTYLLYSVWKKMNFKLHLQVSKVAFFVAFLFGILFIQGYVSAPNTTDSMIYHLPRVMYWMQAKTIFLDQKVTSHEYMPPLAESLVMYLMLLVGNDRLAFLPQWVAGLTVVCTTALIAGELGIDKRGRKFTVLFAATLPMLLLQSVSTQTDLVMTAFVLLSVYFALRKQVIPLAIAVALGFLAKPVFLVYALVPFFLIVPETVSLLRHRLATVIAGIAIMVLIVSPYILTNLRLYGSPLGAQITSDGRTLVLTNEAMDLGLLASNLTRNFLQEIPIPVFGEMIERFITNDPRTTWYGSTFRVSRVFIPQEDIASAPIQVALLILALLLCLFVKVSPMQRRLLLYSGISFVLFCALLKWQPYNPRLHLALFVLALPAAIGVLASYTRLLRALALVSVFLGMVTIIANTSHPFFSYDVVFSRLKGFAPEGVEAPQSIFRQPRADQYYSARPYWREPYRNLAKQLESEKVRSVSVSLFDEYLYPLQIELAKNEITVTVETNSTVITSYPTNAIPIMRQTCYGTLTNYGKICSR